MAIEVLTREQVLWTQAHTIIKHLESDPGTLFDLVADGEAAFIRRTRRAQARAPVDPDLVFTEAELGKIFEHINFWVVEVGKRGQKVRAKKSWRV